jgi:ATP-dependent Lon protease
LIPVSDVDEVIARALVRAPQAIEWEEPPEIPPGPPQALPTGASLPH